MYVLYKYIVKKYQNKINHLMQGQMIKFLYVHICTSHKKIN